MPDEHLPVSSSALPQVLATDNLSGLGVGATSMILPIYISECAPPLIRGRLVGLFEVMLQVALVFGFWVNYGVNLNISPNNPAQWHIPVAIQLVPSCILLLTVPFFCVESPRWLVSKGRSTDALRALSWVRNLPQDHQYVQQELSKIEAGVNHELEMIGNTPGRFSTFKEMAAPGVRNRVIIGTLLMVLQNLTG